MTEARCNQDLCSVHSAWDLGHEDGENALVVAAGMHIQDVKVYV